VAAHPPALPRRADDQDARVTVLVVGTGDTKGDELAYVASVVRARGVDAVVLDVGTTPHDPMPGFTSGDVDPAAIAACHPDGAGGVFSDDRGTAVAMMATALEEYVRSRSDVSGIIGIGGSGGTALITPAMRALPVGVPKVMVSTVAAGNVGSYVGAADIAMVYSVTDVAGLNRISRVVLGNAANAIAGMAANPVPPSDTDRPAVGLTMFGVTTPLVTQLVEALRDRYDPLVFHATGTGGRSMEKLVESGMIVAVLDMTTTEIADLVVGGVFPAGPQRLDVIAASGVPYVGSCGALDMVNFGARATVPERFAERLLLVHNTEVTLMRTTAEENVMFGELIARKLNTCNGPVRFLLPEGGVSLIDAPGQPFWDPEADAALFAAIEQGVEQTADRRVVRVAANVNDPAFADAVLAAFAEVTP
jgi:uncharacterized protein (UPF0261 family)